MGVEKNTVISINNNNNNRTFIKMSLASSYNITESPVIKCDILRGTKKKKAQ